MSWCSLSAGRWWVDAKVLSLQETHDVGRTAIERALGEGAVRGGTGALLLKLDGHVACEYAMAREGVAAACN